MNTDEHDDLWALLGKAKTPEVSPFFARNVLRTIREEAPERGGVLVWLRRPWRLASLGTAAATVVLVVFVTMQQPADTSDQVAALAQQVSISPDYQVIANLDELLASEESSVWLDSPVH